MNECGWINLWHKSCTVVGPLDLLDLVTVLIVASTPLSPFGLLKRLPGSGTPLDDFLISRQAQAHLCTAGRRAVKFDTAV